MRGLAVPKKQIKITLFEYSAIGEIAYVSICGFRVYQRVGTVKKYLFFPVIETGDKNACI